MGSKSKRRRQRQKGDIQRPSVGRPQIASNPSLTIEHTHTQQIVAEHTTTSGPIPPPEVLERYDSIIPDGGSRIMAMAETQAAHRQQMECQIVAAQIRDAQDDRREKRRGQWCGLTIGLAGIIGSAYAIVNGHPIAGSVLGGATLVSLVTVFVAGRKAEPSESAAKK